MCTYHIEIDTSGEEKLLRVFSLDVAYVHDNGAKTCEIAG